MFSKKPLAPYGLTQRYPAGIFHFIKCNYPYNNPETFALPASAVPITNLLLKHQRCHLCCIIFHLCLPCICPPLRHRPPSTGTLHIGPGA